MFLHRLASPSTWRRTAGHGVRTGRAIRARALACAFGALLAAAGCGPGQEPRPHAVLGDGAEPLRSQFNRDAGSIRLLMIVAPT